MACNIAATRLRKELTKLQKDPPPGIIAEPKESDILTWFYALRGPPGTPYEGGIYVGKLKFPSDYPMKPPGILMLTPSGRFVVNTRICMSMSDFHPESWNPLWSVGSILNAVTSFMASEELTTGGVKAPDSERKRLASLSQVYNDKHLSHLFDGDMEAALEEADSAREAAEQSTAAAAASSSHGSTATTGRGRRIAGPRRKIRQTTTTTTPKAATEAEENDTKEKQEDAAQEAEEIESHKEIEAPKELSAAEMEKRKKKNAKKRAKQKAKKAASDGEGHEAEED